MKVAAKQGQRFWDVGKRVGVVCMWLGVVGFFVEMCADKGLLHYHLPAAWVISFMIVGIATGSVARALGNMHQLRADGRDA